MEKYKIITDNLDWYGLFNNYIIISRGETLNGDYWDVLGLEDEELNVTQDMRRIIKMHPSWFQRIEEKDHEVLTVRFNRGGENDIVSVKRLSDGEVFSVGDRVKTNNGNITIRSFREGAFGTMWVEDSMGKTFLDNISHIKQDCLYTEKDLKEAFGAGVLLKEHPGAFRIKYVGFEGGLYTSFDHWYKSYTK